MDTQDSTLPEGFVLNSPQAPQPAQPQPQGEQGTSTLPEGFQLNEPTDYESPGQQLLTVGEGLAQGFAGPLATAAEAGLTKLGVPGLSPIQQEARAQANTGEHIGSNLIGFGAGALTGTGEAAVLESLGKGAAELASLANPVSKIAKIASTGVKATTEMSAIQAGDEISKFINQDPNQTLGLSAINIGLSGILGGVGGVALGTVGSAFKTSLDKIGISRLATDLMGETEFLKGYSNPVEQVQKEINDRLEHTDQLMFGGLKKELIEELSSNINPEQLQNHINEVENLTEKAPKALKEEKIFQNAVDEWKNKVYQQSKPEPLKLPETVTPDYSEIPETVLKAPKPTEARIAQMAAAGKAAENQNLEKLNELGINPYVSQSPTQIPSEPSSVFSATENLKRQLQEWANYNKELVPIAERPFRDASASLATHLKESLENNKIWGEVGNVQKEYNKAVSPLFNIKKEFLGKFTSKELGEKVADPSKITTYLNQAENSVKGKVGLKNNYINNFLKQTQNVADVVSEAYVRNGLEAPFEIHLNPTPVLEHMLNTPVTPGRSLAQWIHRKGAQALGGAIGEAGAAGVGGIAGSMVGHPLLGGWAAEKILGPLFTQLAKPFAETAVNSEAMKSTFEMGANALKGQERMNNSIENFFRSMEVIPKNMMPNEESREKLKKSLAYIDNPQNMMNVGGNIGHYMPSHQVAASQIAATAKNYFDSLKPKTVAVNPFDKEPPADKAQTAAYNRQLDIAQQPLLIIKHAKEGTLIPQDVATLHTISPSLHAAMIQKFNDEIINQKSEGKTIPYNQRVALSLLMGSTPLDSSMTPQNMQAIMRSSISQQVQQQNQQGKQRSATGNALKQINKVNDLYPTGLEARLMKKRA